MSEKQNYYCKIIKKNWSYFRLFGLDDDPNWQFQVLPWHKKFKPLVWQLFNGKKEITIYNMNIILISFFLILEPNSSKTAKVF